MKAKIFSRVFNFRLLILFIQNRKIKSELEILFDKDWYKKTYLEDHFDQLETWNHFMNAGSLLGYDPNIFFDTDWYLQTNEIKLQYGDNPLAHFLRTGWKLGYDPSPQFNTSQYLNKNPDVRNSGINPLVHFVKFGYLEGREPYLSYWPEPILAWKVASSIPRLKKPTDSEGKNAILIPVFNNWKFTERCLRSILKTTDSSQLDIYIVNDGSTDQTSTALNRFKSVNVINTPNNLGFTRACNFAFNVLKDYEYIYLLNNDTEVQEGFFKNCMEIMHKHEKIGIVGSTLHYENGEIQSCGAIIWKNASVTEYGERSNPAGIEFLFPRQVDFCAGAGILIKTEALTRANFFDETYAPAYYEDADLAFTMRKLGYETWVSINSRVIHYGGISYGRDEKSGVSKIVSLNQQKFLEKWWAELQEFSEFTKNNVQIFKAAMRWDPSKVTLNE